jgi:hypothetical protein
LICLVVWRIKEELAVVKVVKWWENEAEDVDAFKEFDANNLRAFRVKCLQLARPGLLAPKFLAYGPPAYQRRLTPESIRG